MKRPEEIKSRVDLGRHRARGPAIGLAYLALLTSLLVGCRGATTPTGEMLPAHLRLSPCGGTSQVQWADTSEWRVVEAPIAMESEARIAVEVPDGGRLCAADGSVLELAPGTTIRLAPAEDASRLEIALQQGSLLFLAVETPYQFAAPGCVLSVTDVPARFSVELNAERTQLRVEEGRANCVTENETSVVQVCSEIIATLGIEPQIGEYCDPALHPTATPVTRSPTPVTPTQEPTATATPSPTPSQTPTSTATPTPTQPVFTSTPVPLPTTTPVPQPTSPPPTSNKPPKDTPEPQPTPKPQPTPRPTAIP